MMKLLAKIGLVIVRPLHRLAATMVITAARRVAAILARQLAAPLARQLAAAVASQAAAATITTTAAAKAPFGRSSKPGSFAN